MVTFDDIEAAIAPTGLIVRGGLHPRPADQVPPLPGGGATATLVVVGNAGPAMWRQLAAQGIDPDHPHALDSWSRRVISGVAEALGAHPLFPFGGPPWHPFQRWAQRAELVWPSPIGPLIHPDYGLWHAYRGALAFAATLELPPRAERPNPCESCAERPCLQTCPVDALKPGAYDVPACVEHISAAAGRDCAELGCRARRACPEGRAYIYQPEQAAFHMRAFIRANRAGA